MQEKSSIPVRSTNKALKNSALSTLGGATRPKSSPDKSLLHAEFKKFKTQSMLSNYKPAKLYKGASYWYAYYYYLIPGTNKYQRFKEYLDINRIHNKADKLFYGQEMLKFLNQKLAEGFNPFTAIKIKSGEDSALILEQLETVRKSISENATKSMENTYISFSNRFKKFIEAKKYEQTVMLQVSNEVADQLQRWMLELQLSRKTINSTVSHMALMWDEAKRLKMVVYNPFREVKSIKKDIRKENDEDIFEPLTFAELQTIVAHTQAEHRNFLRFLFMIYYAWARPVEILRLQVNQFDLKNNYIRFKKGKTKNNKGGYVQIVPQLKKYLVELELQNYPGNYYVFSKTDYLPGPEQRDPKTALKKWGKIVYDQLKIDKRMYALKHTGNIEYLQNNKGNIDLKWQQMQNRHSSAAMTEKYNRQLGAYFIDIEKVNFREF